MSVAESGQARLDNVFARTSQEGRAALVAYFPVGYPKVEDSLDVFTTLVDNGADVVEVGLPYSDPVLDGPVIQLAGDIARENGVRTRDAFTAVRTVVAAGGTAVVMTYWNLVLHYGVEQFAADLAEAGGSGLIIPDLTPDEAGAWLAAADKYGLAPIFLVAPSSTPQRLAMTTGHCRGFVYVASTMGVTGVRSSVGDPARELVQRARAVTHAPLAVGLGVSNREQAAEIAGYADGVIVGSALVKCVDAQQPLAQSLPALAELTRQLCAGVREGR
ncbi:tryptophan synthase subunit alpha [Dermatophilus congolensis]|uniref:Tryptophan synthase alpha chain n=1 Tax=Dermatophilus congolensis TaxID=1863 RepID=A0AA46BNE4_9MICO|nr:tryptophan synthase subunit alpha [Dermatophilus congolensis]MBO3142938.1 tryptophan synthase subunit alpha [Dermatophilus congolensis]MBO3151929.1 tryptophan synthase subunit alpha [Dermatophilus congolensis]MBO3161065.1 tryptophan synthase subunit alpha [Dermatophilus congolensis]MBO3163211.1 tryptophan synthase subunit alpha [Dermatophilus congolensis]MBO3176768.1 tryptophan synthase subunit alpha [Dermatophilus congolensis]